MRRRTSEPAWRHIAAIAAAPKIVGELQLMLRGARMAQVTITLNGRTYRLQCGEGEEPRLIELADVVRGKLQSLVQEFGQAGDDRLLLMTALLIADELLETRVRLASLTQQGFDPGRAAMPPPPQAIPTQPAEAHMAGPAVSLQPPPVPGRTQRPVRSAG